jgi:uncharacterized protein (DUF736 family)
MSYEQKDNSGSLFKNARKEKDTHPDYNGSVRINGVDMWISSWLKKDKNGNTYMSLSFKPKEGNPVRGLADDLRSNSPQAPARGRAPANDIDDSIPF